MITDLIGFESYVEHLKIVNDYEKPARFILPDSISVEMWRQDKHGDKYNLITHNKENYPIASCKILGSLFSIPHFYSKEKLLQITKRFEEYGYIDSKKIAVMSQLNAGATQD